MKLKKQSTAKQNDFYPNCGCKSEERCEPCPHCGMCTLTVDYCACWPTPVGLDKSLQYDPHRESFGG